MSRVKGELVTAFARTFGYEARQDAAEHRRRGYNARVFERSVRADGAPRLLVYVVVVRRRKARR